MPSYCSPSTGQREHAGASSKQSEYSIKHVLFNRPDTFSSICVNLFSTSFFLTGLIPAVTS